MPAPVVLRVLPEKDVVDVAGMEPEIPKVNPIVLPAKAGKVAVPVVENPEVRALDKADPVVTAARVVTAVAEIAIPLLASPRWTPMATASSKEKKSPNGCAPLSPRSTKMATVPSISKK